MTQNKLFIFTRCKKICKELFTRCKKICEELFTICKELLSINSYSHQSNIPKLLYESKYESKYVLKSKNKSSTIGWECLNEIIQNIVKELPDELSRNDNCFIKIENNYLKTVPKKYKLYGKKFHDLKDNLRFGMSSFLMGFVSSEPLEITWGFGNEEFHCSLKVKDNCKNGVVMPFQSLGKEYPLWFDKCTYNSFTIKNVSHHNFYILYLWTDKVNDEKDVFDFSLPEYNIVYKSESLFKFPNTIRLPNTIQCDWKSIN